MKNSLLLLSLLLSASIQLFAQSAAKYLIVFRDKGELGRYTPSQLLSERSLRQRALHHLPIDFTDYPVDASYRAAVRAAGVQEQNVLRWFNGVTAYLTPAQCAHIQQLPCVAYVQPLRHAAPIFSAQGTEGDTLYLNTPTRQLHIPQIDSLHTMGYTGKHVLIAMMDNGFRNADKVPAFKRIFAEGRVIAAKDFVQKDRNVVDFTGLPNSHGNHGAHCFSILAADLDSLRGAAPDADFILLRTENDSSETRQEEDNWAAAAEFADSLGAQIFSTSLGYRSMDDPMQSYDLTQMDGRTALISRAAAMAARKGILVVNSAGNEGGSGITAPADADSILAIGSVNQNRQYSWYSSVGPSADGRIKPDVTTMGEAVFYMTPSGIIRRGNGTSYSCPIIAGLAACLLQANPFASNMQLRDAIIQSADQYTLPDINYGYGIPAGAKALSLLYPTQSFPQEMFVFENPSIGNGINIGIDGLKGENALHIEIYDSIGKCHYSIKQQAYFPYFPVNIQLSTGAYIARVVNQTTGKTYTAKFSVQ